MLPPEGRYTATTFNCSPALQLRLTQPLRITLHMPFSARLAGWAKSMRHSNLPPRFRKRIDTTSLQHNGNGNQVGVITAIVKNRTLQLPLWRLSPALEAH